MREIKFKAQRLDGKGLVVGGFTLDAIGQPRITTAEGEGLIFHKVNPETVCQFTGLLDKDGKEIFEGDIVEAWSQGSHITNGIIRWGIGTCKFFIGNETNSIVWNLCGTGKQYIQEDVQVIGNIHD
jgi:uncharacterized phage protein (TIGR01671 family)